MLFIRYALMYTRKDKEAASETLQQIPRQIVGAHALLLQASVNVQSSVTNLVNQLLASNPSTAHFVEPFANVLQSARHQSMLHRYHFTILQQNGEVFQVRSCGRVVIGYSRIVLAEEPERLERVTSAVKLKEDPLDNITLPSAVYDNIHSSARTPAGRVPLIIPGGSVRMSLLSAFARSVATLSPGSIHLAAMTVDCPSE